MIDDLPENVEVRVKWVKRAAERYGELEYDYIKGEHDGIDSER